MTLKSNIDWNEIIPLLPRAKREELYLEAVTLLSQDDREKEAPTKKKFKSNHERFWERDGDGRVLSATGRKYKINKKMKLQFRGTSNVYSEMWGLLKESHNDIITYEGLASIWEGVRSKFKSMQPLSTIIANLWARHAIDVYNEK